MKKSIHTRFWQENKMGRKDYYIYAVIRYFDKGHWVKGWIVPVGGACYRPGES